MSDQHAPSAGAAAPPDRGESQPPDSPAAEGVADRRVEELEARLAEAEDKWRRALADLDNMRKRVANAADRDRAEERSRVALAFLPIIDTLELALEHAAADPESIVQGVLAVRDQALGVLERLGYPRRDDDAGSSFDPARHEAVAAVPAAASSAAPGTVVGIVRPAYGEGDRQLRPASVVVATGSE
ncbi:MAG: GrpE protein [Acidimicrobiales bacterium]|nr:GrpE protein [Acidimicrobiales bacterium]